MTEFQRRVSIEKIQARQRRYHAMGRCWRGRAIRPGYKRGANCLKGHTQRRAKYQAEGRCCCGPSVMPGTKRNGAPYKTCQQCLDRAKARYQLRRIS